MWGLYRVPIYSISSFSLTPFYMRMVHLLKIMKQCWYTTRNNIDLDSNVLSCHLMSFFFFFLISGSHSELHITGTLAWASWLSIWLLILVQVMISQFVSLSPASGSVLTVQTLLGICSLSLPCSRALSQINKLKKKKQKTHITPLCRLSTGFFRLWQFSRLCFLWLGNWQVLVRYFLLVFVWCFSCDQSGGWDWGRKTK